MREILSRRELLQASAGLGLLAGPWPTASAAHHSTPKMRFGLVTYLWGQDWDVATLLSNCEKTGFQGVELRTQHAHGVDPGLSAEGRREVKAQFAASPVELVGLGSNEAFHSPDPETLKQSIAQTKAFIVLSHDVGGSGVKVKPNDLPDGVPHEKTIAQIGKALKQLGTYGADLGQEIHLEVHGECAKLPTINAIMQVADHPNVRVCWNCNDEDLAGEGLAHNFNLVKNRFGATVHVREMNIGSYPYQDLMNLFTRMDYTGWILLEARTTPEDRMAALNEQRSVFTSMLACAQGKVASGVVATHLKDIVRIEIDGAFFTEYRYKDGPRPYFYPVMAPTGDPIIRHWPMEKGEHEELDHPHHRSLWYSHGSVNGHDFWEENAGHGRIVHDSFVKICSGVKKGSIVSKNNWVADSGEVICTDTRTHHFTKVPGGTLMDFEITYHADHGTVTLGDTKEGSMALRLAPTMRVKGDVGQGTSSTVRVMKTRRHGASGLRGAITTVR